MIALAHPIMFWLICLILLVGFSSLGGVFTVETDDDFWKGFFFTLLCIIGAFIIIGLIAALIWAIGPVNGKG